MDLYQKMVTHELTVKEAISILMLNQLPSQFETLKKIKRNEAKHSGKVPSMESIAEDVKDDMRNRRSNTNTSSNINFVSNKSKGKGKDKDKEQRKSPHAATSPVGRLDIK